MFFNVKKKFTIHFATINTSHQLFGNNIFPNLQYTLLLLIQEFYKQIFRLRKFTIHFATINTGQKLEKTKNKMKFTIHFATINTFEIKNRSFSEIKFTIHFATINTVLK